MNKKTYTAIALTGLIATNLIAIPFLGNFQAKASAPLCTNPKFGVLQDFYTGDTSEKYMLVGYYMNKVQIKNTSTNCAYQVGIASYQAYEHYTKNVYSQTLYASKTKVLQPGEKWEYTVAVPQCTYQVDVFHGDLLTSFKPGQTYGEQKRLLDAWYFPGDEKQRADNWPACVKPTVVPTVKPTVTPTVTPTVKPTVAPTIKPTVKPTTTPTVKPTVAPTVKPTVTPTIEPTVVPTGEVQAATPTPAPVTELPSTGPGAAFLIAMNGIVAALIGRKLFF